jgi:hypothetical protein
LPRIFEGSRSDIFDGEDDLSFRSAARNGKWLVRKAFSNTNPADDDDDDDEEAEPTGHFGYVISHESVDPVAVIQRCSMSRYRRAKPKVKDPVGGKHVQDRGKKALQMTDDDLHQMVDSSESEDDTRDKV